MNFEVKMVSVRIGIKQIRYYKTAQSAINTKKLQWIEFNETSKSSA